MKKKILLQTINYPGIGGIERSFDYLYRELSIKHEVVIVSSSDTQNDNFQVINFPLKYKWLFLSPLQEIFSYINFIRNNKSFFDSFDVVVSRYKPMSVAIMWIYPEKEHIFIPPSVCKDFFDGVIYSITKNEKGIKKYLKVLKYKLITPLCQLFEKYIFSKKCKIITFSENVKNSMLEKHQTRNKIVVQPPGVDDTYFFPINTKILNKLKNKLVIDENDFVILYVGRVSYGKNVDLLVDTFEKLDISSKKLVIVGDGEMITKLQNISNIVLVGKKNISKLRFYYSIANVSVVPTFFEGFGQTYIESLACGTPVIGFNTKRTATKEIIKCNKLGQIATSNDTKGLSTALCEAYQQKDLYKKNRSDLSRSTHKKYRWKNLINEMGL